LLREGVLDCNIIVDGKAEGFIFGAFETTAEGNDVGVLSCVDGVKVFTGRFDVVNEGFEVDIDDACIGVLVGDDGAIVLGRLVGAMIGNPVEFPKLVGLLQ